MKSQTTDGTDNTDEELPVIRLTRGYVDPLTEEGEAGDSVMDFRPSLPASTSCVRLPAGGGSREEKEQPGQAKFSSILGFLRGKTVADKPRRQAALAIVDKWLMPLLRDEDAKAAVGAARRFAMDRLDRDALALARRNVLKLYRRLEADSAQSVSRIQATHIAYLVTLTPFPATHLESIGKTLANTLVWAATEENPKKQWWKHYDQIHDQSLAEMAEIMKTFLPKDKMQTLQMMNALPPDRFDDPRFRHRYLQFVEARQHLVRAKVPTEERKMAEESLAAFGHIQGRKEITLADLRPIVAAASARSTPVQEMSVQMLLVIGRKVEAGRAALLELLSHPRGDVRFRVMSQFQYWKLPYPKDFVRQMIEKGLEDKSAKVRIFSAQACDIYDRKDLIPLLERALRAEKDRETRKSFDFNLRLVRDGYLIENAKGKHPSVTFKTKEGISNIEILPRHTAPDAIKSVIERRLKDSNYWPARED